MNRYSACRKFRRMRLGEDEGRLRPRESQFMATHFAACVFCRGFDAQLTASTLALRVAKLDHQGSTGFVMRVVRALSRERLERQLRAWRPTVAGAVTAVAAVSAVLQVLSAQPDVGSLNPEGSAGAQMNRDELRLFDRPARPVVDIERPDA